MTTIHARQIQLTKMHIKVRDIKKRVTFTLERAMKAQRGSTGLYSFFNLGARLGWMVNATPRSFIPRQTTRYPLYRRLGGPSARSEHAREMSTHEDSIPGPSSP